MCLTTVMVYILSDLNQQVTMDDIRIGLTVVILACILGHVKGQYQNTCPDVCRCDLMPNSKDQSFRKAECTTMPKQQLHNTIKILTVKGHLNQVTQNMISTLGTSLIQLDLSNCNINSIEPGAFNSLTHLIRLILSNNNINQIDSEFSCPHLQELYLDGNGLKAINTASFSQLTKLRELHLENNELRNISTIPSSVQVLDVSNNKLQTIKMDLSTTNLQHINLCGNQLDDFPFQITLQTAITLESLCLEGRATIVPHNTAKMFPHLWNLTLVGSPNNAKLATQTQNELSNMSKVTELTLMNYHLASSFFLSSLKNLNILNLQNITLDSLDDIKSVFQSLNYLQELNIDLSPQLVKPIFTNQKLLSQLNKISLKSTELVILTDHYIPDKETFSIDISNNPLQCDCKLVWILQKERAKSSYLHFLHSEHETKCQTPENVQGETLLTALGVKTCPDTKYNPEILQSFGNYETTTSTVIYEFTEGQHSDKNAQTTENNSSHALIYIILGCVLLILIIIGIVLAITLSVIRKRRKCQISPGAEDTQMQQQQQNITETSSIKDNLLKK